MQFKLNLKRWGLLFVFLGMSGFVHAAEGELAVNYFLDKAQTFYERGKLSQAAREFKKVLLLEPDHISAREHLRTLGVRLNSYSSSIPQVSFKGLKYFSGEKNRRMPDAFAEAGKSTDQKPSNDLQLALNSVIKSQKKDLKKQGHQLKVLEGQLSYAQQQLREQNESYLGQVEKLQGALSRKEESLQRADILLQEKWVSLRDAVARSDHKLDKFKDDILMRDLDLLNCEGILLERDKEIFQLKNVLQRTLNIPSDSMDGKDHFALHHPEDLKLSQLQQEVETFQNKINEQKQVVVSLTRSSSDAVADEDTEKLKEVIQQKDNDILQLKEDLASTKKDIFILKNNASEVSVNKQSSTSGAEEFSKGFADKESALNERDDQIMDLKRKLGESKERQDLSQKIIQEKDLQIKELTESLQNIESKGADQK